MKKPNYLTKLPKHTCCIKLNAHTTIIDEKRFVEAQEALICGKCERAKENSMERLEIYKKIKEEKK
jgi:hypothetical protein